MAKYVAKRILLICLTAFIVLSLTYILIQYLPLVEPMGSATDRIAFWNDQVSLGYYTVVDPIRAQAGLEHYDISFNDGTNWYFYAARPVWDRYIAWIVNIFTKWNWGVSTNLSVGRSAIDIIMQRLPVSIELNIISIVVSIPLGLGLGILAALKKNTWVDDIISTVVMIFISVPSFVVISFLLIIFSYNLGWLPGVWPSNSQAQADPGMAALAYIIPVGALSFGSIAGFARYTRAELCEVMSSEFLLLARTKGLTKTQSVIRHAMRNSMVPIVPMIIGQFISILSGSMILEQLYGIPGIGSLFVKALEGSDYSVVMVDMAIYTLIGLGATLLVDLSYGIVDPRIRMGAKK